MYIDKALVAILVTLPEDTLRHHLPCSPERVGFELASKIDDYVRKHSLGYYPALDYFRELNVLDKVLLDSAEQIAWLVSKLAREEIQTKLRPIFSKVQFESIQTQAFTMPGVRPNKAGAIEQLTKFYTPNTIKIELILSMLRKDSDTAKRKVETYARKMVYRWLRDSFEHVEVTGSAEV